MSNHPDADKALKTDPLTVSRCHDGTKYNCLLSSESLKKIDGWMFDAVFGKMFSHFLLNYIKCFADMLKTYLCAEG